MLLNIKIALILFMIVVFSTLALGYIYYYRGNTNSPETVTRVNSRSLKENNPDFSAGVDAVNGGDLLKSQEAFSAALAKESDTRGRFIIRLNEATAYLRLATTTADKITGVRMASDLTEDTEAPLDIRAYAIQNLCQWYLAARDTELYETIFSNPRFSQYKSVNNRDESIDNLFRYSISFYPLSIPLLKTTLRDADKLVSSSTLSVSAKEEFLKTIPSVLASVDKDTAVVLSGGNPSDLMSIFLARARLLAALETLAGDREYGDPVEYFSKAYERAEISHVGLTKGYALIYLSSYYFNKNDISNMKATLDKLLVDSNITASSFKTFLRKLAVPGESASDNKTADTLRKMALLHPALKERLKSLGWSF